MKKITKRQNFNDIFITDSLNGWITFSVLVGIYVLLTLVSNSLLFTKEIYYRSFTDHFTFQSIEVIWDMQRQYQWLGYVLTPMIVLSKVTFAAVCISIGVILADTSFKFKTIFKIALLAEIVFIAAQTLYLVTLSYHLDTLTLENAPSYFPLSLLSLLDAEQVAVWLHYPLTTLNMFEVLYMTVIAWLLSKQWKPNFFESLNIVIPSYGIGLLLWMALVVFLTLQIN